MTSPITYPIDDKMLDDAALWAVIDSAAAASLTSASKWKNQTPRCSSIQSNLSSHSTTKFSRNPRVYYSPENGEVLQEDPLANKRPYKMARTCTLETSENNPLALVQHVHRSPATPKNSLPNSGRFSMDYCSPIVTMDSSVDPQNDDVKENVRHPMFSPFRSVSLFKEYQNAAMAILEKSDFTMISGNPFIKKSGWRKISCFFNISFEIKDKTIEFDNNRNVLRAEFVARAHMQCGRYSDGWGSCERNEKRFLKPNHDIPSTAETRAKNRACQELVNVVDPEEQAAMLRDREEQAAMLRDRGQGCKIICPVYSIVLSSWTERRLRSKEEEKKWTEDMFSMFPTCVNLIV